MSAPLNSLGPGDWEEIFWSSATAQLIAGAVIWPSFLEIDGLVYVAIPAGRLDGGGRRRYLVARRDAGWSALDVSEQRALAAVHGEVDLGVIFTGELYPGDDIESSLEALGRLLVETWPRAAEVWFPGRTFVAEMDPADDDCGPMIRLLETTPMTERT